MTSSLNRIATIGFFDGVHRGHQYLFEHLRTITDQRKLAPLIVTFEEHPRAALQADYMPHLLTTPSERKSLLSRYGEVLMLPFEQIQPMTAAEFMAWLHTYYDVSVLLMGYDHRFGSDRLLHPQDYRRIGETQGIEVLTMSEYLEGEWHVSSTEIRLALENGNIALANELLGRPYSLFGTVVHGKAVGRTIGFPTANIMPDDPDKIIPKPGVYEVTVTGDGLQAAGFCNIDHRQTIEVHIPSFQGDLYDRKLELLFVRWLRDEKHFEDLETLRTQIQSDIDSFCKKNCK